MTIYKPVHGDSWMGVKYLICFKEFPENEYEVVLKCRVDGQIERTRAGLGERVRIGLTWKQVWP